MAEPISTAPLTPQAAQEQAQSMGLYPSELEAIITSLDRQPTRTEVAIFAGMWSEHCSYKSTLQWLKQLPNGKDNPRILAGPGSHAGAVAVDETYAVAFKVESHNHPSAVEPYQGATTGVGGILRDIIAQGARPTLIMDGLCFGLPGQARNDYLRDGVVAGIAGYGNAIGIPNVGGQTVYDERYTENPLVNALAAGIVKQDAMRTAKAQGVGNALLYAGAATGKDGILGAAFASDDLDTEATAEDRPHVQVGDPYTGKKIMEAVLAFTPEMGMVAGQDMGASGISCASIEMAAAGEVGIDVWLDKIPLRDPNMQPEEIMLSESQERFMFIVETDKAQSAVKHFESYGVHAAICGEVTDTGRTRVSHQGQVVADVDAALVADGAPLCHWPVAESLPAVSAAPAFARPTDFNSVLAQLLQNPNLQSQQAIYERYDQTVGNRTVRGPGQAEAAVMRVGQSDHGYALTLNFRPDLCAVDPYRGTQVGLVEALKDLACVGADMIAITDGLNVASPQDLIENKKIESALMGLKEGLEALDIPVTGGNCSLYNQTSKGGIPPTIMIGGLGLIDNVHKVPSFHFEEDDDVLLVGTLNNKPSAGYYLRQQTGASNTGEVQIDLKTEKHLAQGVAKLVRSGQVRAAKDLAAGGLAIALTKLCHRNPKRLGMSINLPSTMPNPSERLDWALFGERCSAYVLVVPNEHRNKILTLGTKQGLVINSMGEVGGDTLRIEHKGNSLIDYPIT